MFKIQFVHTLLVIMLISGAVFAVDNAAPVEVLTSNETSNHEMYGVQFEPLVLNSLYTQWCLDIAGNMTVDAPCITPHGSQTMFTTDASGSASITIATTTLPSDTFFEVAIAYHNSASVGDNMPVWFDFLPANNTIAAVASTNMLAKHNDNIFQRQSLSPTGHGRYTVGENQATLEFVFESLVSDAGYSLWCVAITAPTNQQMTERPCT